MRRIWDGAKDVFDAEEIESLNERLRVLTDVDEAVKRAHVANIQRRVALPSPPQNRCGSLFRRQGVGGFSAYTLSGPARINHALMFSLSNNFRNE